RHMVVQELICPGAVSFGQPLTTANTSNLRAVIGGFGPSRLTSSTSKRSEKTTQRHLQAFEPNATQHGFRSTFAQWGEENGEKIAVLDAALAHLTKRDDNGGTEGAKVLAAYL